MRGWVSAKVAERRRQQAAIEMKLHSLRNRLKLYRATGCKCYEYGEALMEYARTLGQWEATL